MKGRVDERRTKGRKQWCLLNSRWLFSLFHLTLLYDTVGRADLPQAIHNMHISTKLISWHFSSTGQYAENCMCRLHLLCYFVEMRDGDEWIGYVR